MAIIQVCVFSGSGGSDDRGCAETSRSPFAEIGYDDIMRGAAMLIWLVKSQPVCLSPETGTRR